MRDPRVFRPRRGGASGASSLSTGFEALDRVLPGGGWPTGVLIELLAGRWGVGELRLIMPALVSVSRAGRWVLWVSPPHVPYAPALAAMGLDPGCCIVTRPDSREERIWTVEQALRSGACGAVLAWHCEGAARHARRLQLAAEAGQALALRFRPPSSAGSRSPAALRLLLQASGTGLHIDILKSRGGQTGGLELNI